MNPFTKGTVVHSIWRGVVAFLSFGIPLVFMQFPTWENLTVGGIVFAILHYAESKLSA